MQRVLSLIIRQQVKGKSIKRDNESIKFSFTFWNFRKEEMVARDRIELPTQGFSVPCSTD